MPGIDFSFSEERLLRNADNAAALQQLNTANAFTGSEQALDRKQLDRQRAQEQGFFDVGQQNNLRDFGFQESQFNEDTRRFDVGQQNRNVLLEQLGLATPGGPSGEFGGDGTLFDTLLNGGNGGGQGFSDLLTEQRGARDGLLAGLDDFGASQRANNQRVFDEAGNNAVFNLESRGLGASNLVGSALGQVAGERQQADLELNDQLIGRRTDLAASQNQGIFDTQTGQLERDNKRQLQGISTIGQLTGGLIA